MNINLRPDGTLAIRLEPYERECILTAEMLCQIIEQYESSMEIRAAAVESRQQLHDILLHYYREPAPDTISGESAKTDAVVAESPPDLSQREMVKAAP